MIKRYKIWNLKTFTPQVVDPAQPPININIKNVHQGSYEEDERNAIAVLRVEEEEGERT